MFGFIIVDILISKAMPSAGIRIVRGQGKTVFLLGLLKLVLMIVIVIVIVILLLLHALLLLLLLMPLMQLNLMLILITMLRILVQGKTADITPA